MQERRSKKRRWRQTRCVSHLLPPSLITSIHNVRCSLGVTLCCEERSGYKNSVKQSSFSRTAKDEGWPRPWGDLSDHRGWAAALLATRHWEKASGELIPMNLTTWWWNMELGPVQGGKKTYLEKKNIQSKATQLDSCGVCNADVCGSSEFKS